MTVTLAPEIVNAIAEQAQRERTTPERLVSDSITGLGRCMTEKNQKGDKFADAYPHMSQWVRGGGWIEIGTDYNVHSFLRVLDEGGMVWEGEDEYDTMDEAFQALEAGIAAWLTEQDIE